MIGKSFDKMLKPVHITDIIREMFQHIKEFMIWVLIWILSGSVGSNTFVVYEAQVPWEPTSGGVNLFSTIRTHIDPTVGSSQLLCKQPFILLSVSGCLTYCLTESVCQILSTLAIWQELSTFPFSSSPYENKSSYVWVGLKSGGKNKESLSVPLVQSHVQCRLAFVQDQTTFEHLSTILN